MRGGKKVFGIVLTAVLFVAILAMAAPVVFPGIYTVYQEPEKVLQKRVAGLMDSMVARDWKTCGEYLYGVDGEVQLVSDNHVLEGFDVGQISVAGDQATIMVHVRFRMNIPEVPSVSSFPMTLDQTQTWKKEGFRWYYQYEPISFKELFQGEIGRSLQAPGSVGSSTGEPPAVEGGEPVGEIDPGSK